MVNDIYFFINEEEKRTIKQILVANQIKDKFVQARKKIEYKPNFKECVHLITSQGSFVIDIDNESDAFGRVVLDRLYEFDVNRL